MFRKIARGLLAALLIAGVTITLAQTSSTNSATWSWTAPTAYTDGAPIASGTVITYEIFTGSASHAEAATPAWSGTALTATTSGYAAGSTVYGYVKACISGVCSAASNEASKSFPLPAPAAPSSLTVK